MRDDRPRPTDSARPSRSVITGAIELDLTDSPPPRWRHRADSLRLAPAGAAVLLRVGALAVDPDTVRILAHYADALRLVVTIIGEPHAVRAWVETARSGVTGLVPQ